MNFKFKHYAYAFLAIAASAVFSCKSGGDSTPTPPAVDIALDGTSDANNANVVVKEDAVSDVAETTAKVTGTIVKLASGFTATEYGHVYAKGTSAPTVESGTKMPASGAIKAGSFTSSISGLAEETDYAVRMYVTTSKGTFYGLKTVTFKTKKTATSAAPVVVTGAASDVQTTTFAIAGKITGGEGITEHGHVWSKTNRSPTTADSKTTLGAGTVGKDFSSNVSGLEENTSYYIRAYATNSVGTSYGKTIQVTTSKSLEFFPELTLYFVKVSNDSTEVKFTGELFLSFVRVTNWNAAGGILNIPDPTKQADTVELRFGAGLKQKAHRFTVGKQGAGVPATDYRYKDYVDVPFQVWDTKNNKQLMVSFRDQQEDGQYTLLAMNTDGDGSTHSREYIYIHALDYSETPSSKVTKSGGHEMEQMMAMWLYLKDG